jgi:hypothetical protein
MRTNSKLPGRKTDVQFALQFMGGILVTYLGSVRNPCVYEVAKVFVISGGTRATYVALNGAVPAITLIGDEFSEGVYIFLKVISAV